MSGAWKSTAAKTEITLFSLFHMPVPQVESQTFLGVTLDMRLTCKTHLEAVVARSLRKPCLLKKLAGTT